MTSHGRDRERRLYWWSNTHANATDSLRWTLLCAKERSSRRRVFLVWQRTRADSGGVGRTRADSGGLGGGRGDLGWRRGLLCRRTSGWGYLLWWLSLCFVVRKHFMFFWVVNFGEMTFQQVGAGIALRLPVGGILPRTCSRKKKIKTSFSFAQGALDNKYIAINAPVVTHMGCILRRRICNVYLLMMCKQSGMRCRKILTNEQRILTNLSLT